MFKMIYNIARTELQMLFYSPVAWLILVVFGVQSGMLFADQLAQLVSSQEMGYNIEGSTITIFVCCILLRLRIPRLSWENSSL